MNLERNCLARVPGLEACAEGLERLFLAGNDGLDSEDAAQVSSTPTILIFLSYCSNYLNLPKYL